jgi:rod shape-determining protein MreD
VSALTLLRLTIVVVVAFFLQAVLFDQIVVVGLHPDVMIILPIAAALVAGPRRGASIGFVAGLFADLLVQLPFGLSSLTFVLAGFTAGLIARASGANEQPAGETITCAVLSTATMALYVLLGTIVGQSGLLSAQTLQALAVVGVGALVLSYPVLRAFRWGVRGSARAYAVPSGGSALS